MTLSTWRKLVHLVRETPRPARRGQRLATDDRFFRGLWLEPLEDRTLLSTFQWLGGGATANWNDPTNWNRTAGTTGTFPSVAGDIARFTGTYTAAQTVTVNVAITVGEIDFGTASNVTIAASGSNLLTLQNATGNAVLNVGSGALTNSGVDQINAPLVVSTTDAATNPAALSATVGGGTLQLTNTATGATANVLGSTSTFTVNTGGTLRASAAGSGSLVTANLVDTGALGSAAVNLAGGTFTLDPTASTASNGLASQFIGTTGGTQENLLNFNDPTALLTGSPTFVTSAASTTAGLANTISFGTAGGTVPFYASQTQNTNFGVRLQGMINIPQAGAVAFTSSSDDGTRLFVDGTLVVTDDGPHGVQNHSNTINLSAGLHDIRLDFAQGGGGDVAQVFYTVGGITQPIPFTALYTPDPLTLGNAVTVSANSTIQLNGSAFTDIGLGALTVTGNSALTVAGAAGKRLNFASSTFTAGATGVTTQTLTDTPDVSLGVVTATPTSPATLILAKAGPGQLILDNSVGTANAITGTTIDVQAGNLAAVGSGDPAATDPLGSASLILDGGTLTLDSQFANPTVPFDNAVAVNQSSTIVAPMGGVTVVLGSAANGITIASGKTLTLAPVAGDQQIAGATLQINGTISGAGSVVVTTLPLGTALPPGVSSTAALGLTNTITAFGATVYTASGSVVLANAAANTYTGSTAINGANLVVQGPAGTGAPTAAMGTLTLNFGSNLIVNNAGTVTGTTGFVVNPGVTFLVDDSSSPVADRIGDTATLTLNGGTFTYLANAAGSTETLGALTLGFGQSTINAGVTGGANSTLTFASLARNLGATVNFTGGVNGTGDNVVFTTATSVTGLLQGVGIGNGGAGILPFAEVNGGANAGDFASYNQTGTMGIAAFTGYNVQTFSGAGQVTAAATDIVQIEVGAGPSTAFTITAPANNIAGLVINNTSGQNVNFAPLPDTTLNISSGGIITQGSSGTVTLGNNTSQNNVAVPLTGGGYFSLGSGTTPEGILFQNASANNTTFNSPIVDPASGHGSLTISGTNTVSFPALNLGSAFTNTTINQNAAQTLTIDPAATGGTFKLTFNGQTTAPILYVPATPATTATNIQNALNALPGVGRDAVGNNNFTVSTTFAAAGSNEVFVITFINQLGGQNFPEMTVDTSGLVGATPANSSVVTTINGGQADTYTGTTTINAGTTIIQNNRNFGSGPLVLNGGTLQSSGTTGTGSGNVLNNPTTINGPVTLTTNNGPNVGLTGNTSSANATWTFAGPITLAPTNRLTVNGGNSPVAFTGVVSGAQLYMAGGNSATSGLQLLNPGNTFAGTTLAGGTITVGAAGAAARAPSPWRAAAWTPSPT